MPATSDFYEACCNNQSTDGIGALKILKHHPHLLDKHFDNQNEDTPLTLACSRGAYGVVKCLVEQGAALFRRNKNGDNALMVAIQTGHLKIVQFLLRDCASLINDVNAKGDTALMIACKIGNVAMIKEILKYNPDVLLKNENGDDAWELTCEFTADKTNQPIIRSLMDNFTHVFIAHDWAYDQFNFLIDEERLNNIQLELRRTYGLKLWYHRDFTSGDIRRHIESGLSNTCAVLLCLTSRYRDKINKTTRRKLYDPRDQCVFEFHSIVNIIGKDKIIPMLFDGKMKYLMDGGKDGELGTVLNGNTQYIDMSDVYVTHEEKASSTLLSEVENAGMLNDGESSPASPVTVKSPVPAFFPSPTNKFKDRVRSLYEIIHSVVFPSP
eukprot:gene1771-1889_t